LSKAHQSRFTKNNRQWHFHSLGKNTFSRKFLFEIQKKGGAKLPPFFLISVGSMGEHTPLPTHGFAHPHAQRKSLEQHISMNDIARHVG
jgi:hypothetical protein